MANREGENPGSIRQPKRRKADRGSKEEKSVRVLAVDDDRAYLKYLELILKRASFEVITTIDANSAIDLLRADPTIDLLVVDLAMPIMDGIEMVRRIREEAHTTGLYAILLTAHDGTDVKLRALDSGLDDFLTKTSSQEEIVAKLRSAARRVEMERRLHLENEELQTLALTDELTGIANRRALFREGEAILASGRSLSAILFDLDSFKQVNDTCGHLMGDRILADVAATLKAATRYGDVIARYGGDEFVLLLPDTAAPAARAIAERILEKIAAIRWTAATRTLQTTAGYGCAESRAGDTLADVLTRCDRALYRRKDASRGGTHRRGVEQRV